MTAIAQAQDDDADRTAWLIEMETDCLSRGSIAWFGIHYWHPTKGFSHEIDEALQFARKQDAEAFKREFNLNGKVVEHMWPAARLSVTTPDTTVLKACATCDGKGVYDSYDGDGRAFEFECYTCHGTGRAALASTANPTGAPE